MDIPFYNEHLSGSEVWNRPFQVYGIDRSMGMVSTVPWVWTKLDHCVAHAQSFRWYWKHLSALL